MIYLPAVGSAFETGICIACILGSHIDLDCKYSYRIEIEIEIEIEIGIEITRTEDRDRGGVFS